MDEAAAVSAEEKKKPETERERVSKGVGGVRVKACAQSDRAVAFEPTIFYFIGREIPLIAVHGRVELRVRIQLVERLGEVVQSGGHVGLEDAVQVRHGEDGAALGKLRVAQRGAVRTHHEVERQQLSRLRIGAVGFANQPEVLRRRRINGVLDAFHQSAQRESTRKSAQRKREVSKRPQKKSAQRKEKGGCSYH